MELFITMNCIKLHGFGIFYIVIVKRMSSPYCPEASFSFRGQRLSAVFLIGGIKIPVYTLLTSKKLTIRRFFPNYRIFFDGLSYKFGLVIQQLENRVVAMKKLYDS